MTSQNTPISGVNKDTRGLGHEHRTRAGWQCGTLWCTLSVLRASAQRSEANPGLSTMKAAKDKEGWVFISEVWEDPQTKTRVPS